LPGDIVDFQHDPLTCAVALGWDGVAIERPPLTLSMEDGWLRMRVGRGGRGLRVVTDVDHTRFDDFWLETVRRGASPNARRC
jgi:hypothetical protein